MGILKNFSLSLNGCFFVLLIIGCPQDQCGEEVAQEMFRKSKILEREAESRGWATAVNREHWAVWHQIHLCSSLPTDALPHHTLHCLCLLPRDPLVSRPLDDLCIYIWISVMSQHPNNRETGYSNVLEIHPPNPIRPSTYSTTVLHPFMTC